MRSKFTKKSMFIASATCFLLIGGVAPALADSTPSNQILKDDITVTNNSDYTLRYVVFRDGNSNAKLVDSTGVIDPGDHGTAVVTVPQGQDSNYRIAYSLVGSGKDLQVGAQRYAGVPSQIDWMGGVYRDDNQQPDPSHRVEGTTTDITPWETALTFTVS